MKRRSKLEEVKAKAQQKTNETKINKTSTNHTSQKMDQNQSTGQELLLWMADIKDEYILEAEDCKPQQTEKRVPGYLIAIGTFAAAAAIFTAVLMQSGQNWFNHDKNPIQLPVQTQESEEIQETEWESETSTEETSQKAEETIWMPQYQVRYPARAEVTDELWNWLVEYGCLEPYQKIQQYYEEYQAAHPAYNQGELHCYPGKVAFLSYGGGDQVIIRQNNMEYSYTGPAIYSKEELPQGLENIYRYASYQYGDYSLSKNLEKIDLEGCSRTEAADYCNGIMKQYGYEFASVDVYTITYEHIQEIVNDPRYKEWCFAPGYDPVNQTGGEWRKGDDAYLIVYRDLSWNNQPIQVSEYASWNYAIYSPRYGLIWMTIQYSPEYLGETQCAIISEEEALKEAEIKFKKDFADVETQIISSEVIYSLDSDNGTNTTYEYGNEWQGTFSPYWKVTFSMASMFTGDSEENAEQSQPVVDILVPAVQ